MLLLLLLVTPLVNSVHDSWTSPCTCTLPEPLQIISSAETLNGTWFRLYNTGNWPCRTVTFIDNGDTTMNISLTETMENECSQTIVTYYGTITIGQNNTYTNIIPCKPEWNGEFVTLPTVGKPYRIYGFCTLGYCEPVYSIAFKSMNPSDCTMNQVKKDLTRLGLCFDNFQYSC